MVATIGWMSAKRLSRNENIIWTGLIAAGFGIGQRNISVSVSESAAEEHQCTAVPKCLYRYINAYNFCSRYRKITLTHIVLRQLNVKHVLCFAKSLNVETIKTFYRK